MNGNGVTHGERVTEPVGVVAAVGQQHRGLRHGLEHERRARVVAHLAFDEQNDAGAATVVADDVKLGA